MELKNKYVVGLCLAMAFSPMLKAKAEYYNSALGPAYRTTQTTMVNAIANKETQNSIVTSIKNQGTTGMCWAFAVNAAVETSLMKQMEKAGLTPQDFNLSQKYTGWMMYARTKAETANPPNSHPFFVTTKQPSEQELKGYPKTEPDRTTFKTLCEGGLLEEEMSALMGNFILPQNSNPALKFYPAPVDASKNIVDAAISPTYKARDVYTKYGVNNAMGVNSSTQLSQLQQYKDLVKITGALGVGYYTAGENTTNSLGAVYNSIASSPDHAVIVVGYDDDYDFSESYLPIKPPGKGAWIVKNSWGTVSADGTTVADAGYYYISYYDKTVSFTYAPVIETDIARYTITDTHTPLYTKEGLVDKLGQPARANTYISHYAQTKDQFLKAVSFMTSSDGASYKIEILKNTTNPDSKPVYTQSGTFSGDNKMSGYHTVDLNNFILVPQGENYSIRITVTGSGGTQILRYSSLDSSEKTVNVVYNDGNSLYKNSQGQWKDANKMLKGAVVLNGQAKETNLANGADFTVSSLNTNKDSTVSINLGKASESYTTDILNPNRKTISNMTVNSAYDDDFWGTITGEGGVTKLGAAELSFYKDNTYTGTTNVNQGVLTNYSSTASNVDVKSGAFYRVITCIKETINQRGIKNEGTVYIAADKNGTVNFAKTTAGSNNVLQGSSAGIWCLNVKDSPFEKHATNGNIIMNADTDGVSGTVYLVSGTISSDQTNFFVNATKHNSAGVKLNLKDSPATKSGSSGPLGARLLGAPSSTPLSTVNLGKMVVDGTTEIDVDIAPTTSELRTDLVKGKVVKADGSDDNSPNKIKLGFVLNKDVTFADATNGVSSKVTQGQLGNDVNNSAFAISRNSATGSYNISYSYDGTAQEGTLKILNAAAPTSLQDALTSAVTSKYYSLNSNQVLDSSWDENLNGNDLTLVGNNTEINGNRNVQIFNVAKDKMLNLQDLSVTKGTGTAVHNEGALCVTSANSDVTFTDNDGTNGGAIYNKDETVLLTSGNNINIQNNTAVNGAGIYNDSDASSDPPEVSASAETGDIVFDTNTASTNGGAIYNKGDLYLASNGGNVQLNNNQAQSGAGIYNTGYLSIYAPDKAIDFNNNKAAANGGAILNDGGYVDILSEGGSVNFSQNQAVNGGAIYNTKTGGGSDPAVVNVTADGGNITFDGNIASNKGGAIYNTETMNIAALDNRTIAFKQSTDSIYNIGSVNFNHNTDYDQTQGVISTGAQLGGTGTYNLYGGQLAFVKASNNPSAIGSISHDSTLSIINDATLNLANGVKETFNPGTLQIASNTALFVAIDCIIKGSSSEGDYLDAGTYTKGTNSEIIIAAVNLINQDNENKASYRINIAGSTLESAISENVLAVIAGYRSAYSSESGDLYLLSTAIKGLVDSVEATDSSRIYSMTQDELVIFPLGNMGGTNSTLTINGNNNKVTSGFSDIDGITVTATNTLNANNVSFDNFETAITNEGTLNLNNVIFNGQVGSGFYDVKNSSTMSATNYVSGRVYNSGTFIAGTTNNLSDLSIRTIDGSILDLRNTTNDVQLNDLSIAGNVKLYLNGTNKLSTATAQRDAVSDSILIKIISSITSANTVVTDTDDLKPFIKLADDVSFSLADSAKPVGTYNAYKLAYSDGNVSVAGVDLSDSSEKSGSHNIESSTGFVASGTNTIASDKTVTLNGKTSSPPTINLAHDTTVSGTLGLHNLTLNGGTLTLNNVDSANLNVTGSTVNNNLQLTGGNAIFDNSSLNGDITMGNTAVLSFTGGTNTVGGAITGTSGSSLVIDAPTTFNNTVDPVSETVNSFATHNANVSQVDFSLNDGGLLTFTKDSYLNNDNTNLLHFNGGSLNLMNGAANTINLQELSFAAATNNVVVSNMYVDVDLANKTMDKLQATTTNVGSGSILNVAGMKLLSDAKDDNTSINFTTNDNLKAIVQTSVTNVAYSPIYQYLVGYNGTSGNFDFTRSFNPSVLASPIAAQVGSYLTQVDSYNQAFGNMDMMMSMTSQQRQAMKLANKYAAAGNETNLVTFSPNQIPEQDAGGWFRPYTTIENVGLNGGPTVRNVSFGSLFGGDTPIMELKNGWDAVFTGYAGYNGSHQTYEGVGIYQNGATVGATGVFYKGDFFTGVTANVGANAGEANTMFGKENFAMLATGIASKTGYNWELANGKFIIQPNLLMSYTFVNTFNYTNAAGVNISSNPLNAIQIAPGVRFIGNLNNGWQPYAAVQMVWNIMDQTRFSANDVSLPDLSIGPYIQYGIGLQRRWGERFTGYGQAMVFNGGRTGIAFQFGFRWALGKDPKKMSCRTKKTAELKKCNINLQSFKSDEPILNKSL